MIYENPKKKINEFYQEECDDRSIFSEVTFLNETNATKYRRIIKKSDDYKKLLELKKEFKKAEGDKKEKIRKEAIALCDKLIEKAKDIPADPVWAANARFANYDGRFNKNTGVAYNTYTREEFIAKIKEFKDYFKVF